MDFDTARGAVTAHLDGLYADEPQSPAVRTYGFDTGQSWAPLIDWDGLMGVYVYLVDKRSGALTPLSFPEFEEVPDPQQVGPWPTDRLTALVARTRLLNHPGHADQKSHGRKRGVRAALKSAKTTEELNAAARAEAKRITGRNVEFDMAGQDLQIAREHAEGILRGLERYPDADLAFVGSYGPGGSRGPMAQQLEASYSGSYAVTAGSAIYFNNLTAASPDAYRASLQMGELRGDLASGSPTGVALHEFGHVVMRSADAGVDTAVIETARSMAASKGQDTQHYIAERVSNYATESVNELAAEAFADVMSFGAESSPLSRSIVDTIDTLYIGGSG